MKTDARRKARGEPASNSTSARDDDAAGLAELLLSARTAVRGRLGEDACLPLLDRGISHLLKRRPTQADFARHAWRTRPPSVPALIRALNYARREALGLDDLLCSELLAECVAILIDRDLLSSPGQDAPAISFN